MVPLGRDRHPTQALSRQALSRMVSRRPRLSIAVSSSRRSTSKSVRVPNFATMNCLAASAWEPGHSVSVPAPVGVGTGQRVECEGHCFALA